MKVYVVTGLELGWDCVVGVFHNVDYDELMLEFPDEQFVITEQTVQETLT